MSILAWILMGLIAGFISSKLIDRTDSGLLTDIVIGILGAFLGGWLFNAFGFMGVTGFNVWSTFVSVIGALLFLSLYHAVRRAV